MDVLASASFVLQNEALTQNRLTKDVNALASGLRVNSAVDDPSGYAIAETIQSKVLGLNQAAQNVQTANNLLNVADASLNTITSLLQRIRSLIVESNSDINSASDLANIQTEINQMLLEINRVSSETNFNGLSLFTGQFDNGSSGTTITKPTITEVPSPIQINGSNGGNQVSNSMIDSQGNATGPGPGPLVEPFHQGFPPGQIVPAYMTFTVISYSNNAVDPDTGTNVGPGVYIEFNAYSSSPLLGAAPLYTDISAVPVNAGPIINVPYAAPSAHGGGPNLLLQFSLANLTQNDVGASAAFVTNIPPATYPNGNPLQINDGGDEGTTLNIDIPQINTSSLNIGGLNIEAPQTINFMNQLSGQAQSNQIAASSAEVNVDAALTTVNLIRAQIGAQFVSTNVDLDNDNTASVQLTASMSAIRDADIGATVTDFTQAQIISQVSNSVLSQLELSATQVTALLLNSFAGPASTGLG